MVKRLTWLWFVFVIILAGGAVFILWWWRSSIDTVSTCSSQDIALGIGTTHEADGVTYVHAVLTNSGSVSCKMSGYPQVSMLDAQGTQFSQGEAQKNESYEVKTVTLDAGGQAHVLLAFPDVSSFGSSGVCSAKSTTLRLYLPDSGVSTAALTTPLEQEVCPGFSASTILSGS